MLLLSINYVPDKKIEALGLVKGNVVQSSHLGKDIMSGLKTVVGGEIAGYTEMLNQARQIAMKRMVDEAESGSGCGDQYPLCFRICDERRCGSHCLWHSR